MRLGGDDDDDMENSFVTHRDDREDYSVVRVQTPLVGFLNQNQWRLTGVTGETAVLMFLDLL